jgi:hypothetical protein
MSKFIEVTCDDGSIIVLNSSYIVCCTQKAGGQFCEIELYGKEPITFTDTYKSLCSRLDVLKSDDDRNIFIDRESGNIAIIGKKSD